MTVTYLPLVEPVRKHGWRDRALCAQIGGDIWFPEKGGDSGVAAKRVCRACPVTAECLAYALEMGEEYGVWGGMSPQQRRRLNGGPVRYERRTDGEKHCGHCRKAKPVGEFGTNAAMEDGLQIYCRPCRERRNQRAREAA